MKLPDYEQAVVLRHKVTAYLLSLTHRDGRGKGTFFMRFGFTINNWEQLAHALLRHAADHEVAEVETTSFGTNYVIEGDLVAPDGRSPRVRVIWLVATGEQIPTLATAYPLKGTHND